MKEIIISSRPRIIVRLYAKYASVTMIAAPEITEYQITEEGVKKINRFFDSIIPYIKPHSFCTAGWYSHVVVSKEFVGNVIKTYLDAYSQHRIEREATVTGEVLR